MPSRVGQAQTLEGIRLHFGCFHKEREYISSIFSLITLQLNLDSLMSLNVIL